MVVPKSRSPPLAVNRIAAAVEALLERQLEGA
jgi:hypothetical protein